MPDKIAIDIALLPPDEIMDFAVNINRENHPVFKLNKSSCLPHITLSQAVLKKADLEEAIARLKLIAAKFKPLRLKAKIIPNFIEPYENSKLNELHAVVMEEFKDLVSYDARQEYFYDDYVRPKSLGYVRNYRAKYALSNYYPHLTLGVTEPLKPMPDIKFAIRRLAICHLGNYNTCRKILFETVLRER